MSVLIDLQARLISQHVGTSDNVFTTYLNDAPDAALCIVQTGGEAPVKVNALGGGMAVYERYTVTVYARETTSAAAEALLASAMAALELTDTTLGTTEYIRITRTGEAQPAGWSGKRIVIGQQFSVERRV